MDTYLMISDDAKLNTRFDQRSGQKSFCPETRLAAPFDGGHS